MYNTHDIPTASGVDADLKSLPVRHFFTEKCCLYSNSSCLGVTKAAFEGIYIHGKKKIETRHFFFFEPQTGEYTKIK